MHTYPTAPRCEEGVMVRELTKQKSMCLFVCVYVFVCLFVCVLCTCVYLRSTQNMPKPHIVVSKVYSAAHNTPYCQPLSPPPVRILQLAALWQPRLASVSARDSSLRRRGEWAVHMEVWQFMVTSMQHKLDLIPYSKGLDQMAAVLAWECIPAPHPTPTCHRTQTGGHRP